MPSQRESVVLVEMEIRRKNLLSMKFVTIVVKEDI